MYHAVYRLGILIQIFHLFATAQCQCPEYFRYFRNETTGEIMGIVEIPQPPQNVPLYLRVILSVCTVLPTKYVGCIELEKSKEESMRSILQGPPATGMIVTNMILEHTLYPPRVILPLTEQLLNFISNSSTIPVTPNPWSDRRTSTMTLPDEIETPAPTSEPSNFQFYRPSKPKPLDSSCGLTNDFSPVAANGEAVTPVMCPWLAAVFIIKDELEFKCNGNLISRQFVLTVAHCLRDEGENVPPSMFVVSLGRFNLFDWNDEGSVNVDVLEYKVHPDYVNPLSADSDLAIIKLMERVEYTPRIRPVCLWIGKPELENVVGRSGYVAGWQEVQQNKRFSSEPRMFGVPIVSQEECLRSNIAFVDVTSNRTFCAGKRNGNGPCVGGSGSGFVMYHARLARYHLRGIVSLSTIDAKTRLCDFKEYVVYVDIAKYLSWIYQEMIP